VQARRPTLAENLKSRVCNGRRDFDLLKIFRIHGDNIVGSREQGVPWAGVSYDSRRSVGRATMLKRQLLDDNGNKVYESLPLLPAVPICFPRAGGYASLFRWPLRLRVGQLFDASMAEWLATGQESEPWDTRKHGLSVRSHTLVFYPDTAPCIGGSECTRGRHVIVRTGATNRFASSRESSN